MGTHDGVPSNPPRGVLAGCPPINDFAGNWVSIRIAPRRYLLYAHMVPGSVQVRTGQQVRRGQVIGLLGNSGNSSTPHLHFQVSDRPGFAPVDSVPYVFDRFAFVGQITDEFSDKTLALQPTGDLAFARPAHRACAGRRGRWTATCSGSREAARGGGSAPMTLGAAP